MADEGISFERVHARELRKMGLEAGGNHVGLALSGGGIRSATFSLGVLQALAKHGLLSRVDYLSTVSGGGYIGSWLSAWTARKNWDIDRVQAALAGDREPDEVSFLREYSNYLTPRVGWLTPDTLTMAATYLRNLLLNFTIIVSWFAIFMLAPWGIVHFGARIPAITLIWVSVALLVFAVGFVIANVVWQELDENKPRDMTPGRARAPFYTRTAWIQLLIVLPLTLWGYVLSAALRSDPKLLDLAAWSVVAVGLCAGFAVVRQLFLGWHAKRRRVRGRFSLWRRMLAFVLGTLAAVGLIEVLVRQFGEVSKWHVMVWGTPTMLAVFLLGATLVLGISGRTESEYAREWWSRLGGLLFRVMAVWVLMTGAAIYGPLLAAQLSALAAAHLSAAWLLTTIASVVLGKSHKTGGEGSSKWLELVPKIGPYVFIVGLLILVSTALYAGLVDYPWTFERPETYFEALDKLDAGRAALLAASLAALALLLSWAIDVNLFSFHMFYRNRLVRCYLGASRPGERSALPFVGFDPRDNPDLKDLRRRPYHIVNTALNLTSSRRLRWQERRAASFVLTKDHCGYEYPKLGPSGDVVQRCFQSTRFYARNSAGSLNLGTAMAISGAAANPNMGYHSSPSVAFLLTVFNVRLGWWMQNTSSPQHWCAGGPHFGLWYLLRELFGVSTDETRFVQLSDGGHFDNLGIYELVRRRCRFIVVVDAGADGKYEFEDLGNAIRKASIDLNVDISIGKRALVPDAQTGRSLYHCAVGTIRYDRTSTPGYLLYLKATLTGSEPADVAQYAAARPAFPHESTADQFFSESQFESYRKLGFHSADTVFEDAIAKARHGDHLDIETLFVGLKERWCPPASGAGAFARHGDRFSELQEVLRADPNLAFLDAQTYPEWDTLVADRCGIPPSPERLWLPTKFEELHAGFHFCMSVLQLMENVYLDLNLQQEYDHPDNRGWMNLFRHWSWSGMFEVTYAMSCSMYGARFQTFMERRLKLRPGSVHVTPCGREVTGLNFVEKEIAAKLDAAHVEYDTVWLLQTVVRSPDELERSKAPERAFVYTFGFCLTRGDEMVYFRVQDHVRNMGNARHALVALFFVKTWRNATREAAEHAAWLEPHDVASFAHLFDSVRQQERTDRRRG